MQRGLFGPWETWRKIAGAAMAAFVIILVVALSIPVGVAAVGALFLAAYLWKDPTSVTDYDRQQYTMMTKPYRVATFFTTIHERAAELFSPVVLVGAGPPREDPDHDLQPGFWPPYRLSSWWALLGALCLAPLEIIINQARFSAWGFDIPWPIMLFLAIPGWYAFFQILADAKRIAPDKDKGGLAEAAPATMLNKIDDHLELRPSLVRSAVFAAIPVGVVVVLWIVIKFPWWLALAVAVVSFALMGAALWSRNLKNEYRAAWEEREGRAEMWMGTWMTLLPNSSATPIFADEFELPTIDEHEYALQQWEREQGDSDDLDSDPPVYEVLVKCAAFQYPAGMTFDKVAMHVEGLRGALGAGLVGIVPIGELNAMGQELNGTVGSMGFRVFYSEQTTQLPNMLDPDANEWATRLSIQAKIVEPLSQVKGVGRVVLVQHYMVTRPESPQQIICVKLRPRNPGVSVEVFLERLSDIQRASSVRWVRVGQGNDEGEIVMYLGEEPVTDVTQFNRPASRENETIDRMNWLYYFHANQLRGESGTPRLIRREPTTPVVDKLTFSLPPGLPMKRVRAAEEAIATTSGNEFIEISLKPPSEPTPSRHGRQQQRTQLGTQFSIIAAKENPLRRIFNFTDFTDKVLTGREPGVAKINWAAGVLSDDSLAYDDWGNSDNPHLLIAGASGSGKEADVDSPILTAEGFKRLGDIKEGDVVFDAEGATTKVIHAFEDRRPSEAFDVIFSDGSKSRTSGTHLWSLSTREDRLARADAKGKNRSARGYVARSVAEVERLTAISNALLMDDRIDAPDSRLPGSAFTHHGEYVDAEAWTSHESARVVNPTEVREDTDWPYLAGLILGCGQVGGATVALATSDKGFSETAAARGIKLSLQRKSGGRERYNVLGSVRSSPAWDLVSAAGIGAKIAKDDARSILDGIAYASGWRDGENTVLNLRESALSGQSAKALASSAGMELRVVKQGGSVMLLLPERCEVSDTSLERLASQTLSEMLFDREGRRVLSIGTTSILTGVSVETVRRVVSRTGILPTAAWQSPTVQRYGTGVALKASRKTDLYRASDLSRALLNDAKSLLRADLPEHLSVSEFTTAEISERVISDNGEREFSVESRCVIFPEQIDPLPVDPYALGAWLGDGVSRTGEICGMDDELFERIDKSYECSNVRFSESIGGGRYRVARWKNLSAFLREMGALWPAPKRIPDEYLRASVASRVALIQGILDTDGHISSQGNVELTLADRDLLDDAVGVLRSLGIVVSEPSKKTAQLKDKNFTAWRVTFTTDLPVFHLTRKKRLLPDSVSDRRRRRYIVDVKPVPESEIPMMRCISVDSPSRTYLIGRALVPTHNSVVMSSMILQICANNFPTEAQVWMIEPKNEMQIYRDTDNVTRFVDSWSPNKEFVKNAADLVEDAVEEMNRRNEALVNHPKRPKELKKAREIAIRESEQAGTPVERHPLYMPYLFVIIEECASLFSDVRPAEKDDQSRLLGATAELARKARSAGIHLIIATQYPTKSSLPTVVRNQCRSVGMKCQNEVASRVVINETGLEDINIKGCGKVRVGGEMRLFRGFFVQDGDEDYGEANDIISTLKQLPSNNGQASAMRKAGETPRIQLPELGESVFALWDKSSSGGRAQASMVADGSGGYAPGELAAAPGQAEPTLTAPLQAATRTTSAANKEPRDDFD